MEKDNKRYSIFASQDIVSKLKKGRNPLPKRIKNLDSCKTITWYDIITGDYYRYTPSQKRQYDGKPLGYSFECLCLRDGATYIREIAEYSDDRSKDKYRINGEYVTREEFFDEISKISLNQTDTTKNTKQEVIEELLSHGNYEVVKSCMRSMELDLEAKDLVKNAIELEKEESESHDRKLLDKAVRLYIDSEILKKQSNVEFQRAMLQDFFADITDERTIFKSRLFDLMRTHYFTNLEEPEVEEITKYLVAVFSTKGLNDVIEFLLKMKETRIEYYDDLIFTINPQTKIPCSIPGVTSFSYTTNGEDKKHLELDQTIITLCRFLDDEELKKAKWHEFSRVLLQPFTGTDDEKTLEDKTAHYTDELLGNSGVLARKLKI